MIYNKLDKPVYLKSRYELMELLENIKPTNEDVFGGLIQLNDVAKFCEEKIDTYFPHIPFSEELLALFSHMMSNAGAVTVELQHAIMSGNRAQAWFAMRYAQADNIRRPSTAISRCIYEANIFGLFDNPDEVTKSEIESIDHFLHSDYKNNQTHWQYILNNEGDYGHPLCIHQLLKLIQFQTEKHVVEEVVVKNILYL